MKMLSGRSRNMILTICSFVLLFQILLSCDAEAEGDNSEAWTLENVLPAEAYDGGFMFGAYELGEGQENPVINPEAPFPEQEDSGDTDLEERQNQDPDTDQGEEDSLGNDVGEKTENGWDDRTEESESLGEDPEEFYREDPEPVIGEDGTVTEYSTFSQVVAEDVEDVSSEELLTAYAEMIMNGVSRARGRLQLRNDALITGNRLEGIDRAIYNELKAQIAQVAAGALTSTALSVPVENLGLDKTRWTAEDLGLDTLVDRNPDGTVKGITEEAKALVAMTMDFDLNRILYALLSDCPYELYWFDKTGGIVGGSYGLTRDRQGTYIQITGPLVFNFAVAEEYSTGETTTVRYRDSEGNTHTEELLLTVDGQHGQAVTSAAANAAAIIERYANLSDLEKLRAYGNAICALTDYNMGAAYDSSTPYGNPWQLIWVFDGNDNTKVVCEGYAKAFQYLCDRSSFQNGIVCYSVTGKLNKSEEHMWNIVRMEDGLNYLVDLTNADGGESMNGNLFLAGSEDGDVPNGYTITNDEGTISVFYLYSRSALNLFTEEELTLAPYDYRSHEHVPGEPEKKDLIAATCTEEGSYDEVIYCTVCGEELSRETYEIPMIPHSPGEAEVENEVPATYSAEGSYEEAVYCTVCGEELSRVVVTVRKLDLPVPELSDLTVVSGGIRVKWKASDDAERYRVYRRGAEDEDWSLVAETENLYYTDTGVRGGETYRYAVAAVIDKQESERSNEKKALYPEESDPDDKPDPVIKTPTTRDTAQPERLVLLMVLSLAGMIAVRSEMIAIRRKFGFTDDGQGRA